MTMRRHPIEIDSRSGLLLPRGLRGAYMAAPQQALFMAGNSTFYYGWNSADKNASITLSEGATKASISASTGAVRGLTNRSAASDHRYFEISTADSVDKKSLMGIGNSSASLSWYPGYDSNGRGYYCFDGTKYNAGSSAYATTVVVGVDVDFDAGEIRFIRGGVNIGTAYTGMASGTYYIMWGSFTSTGSHIGTLNAGGSAFAYEAYRSSVSATAWGASETWNSADKDSDVALSGGDLVATVSDGANGGVRSIGGHSSGRKYFEVTLGGNNGSTRYRSLAGVAKSGSPVNNGYPGNDADGYGYLWGDDKKYHSGTGTAYSTPEEIVGVHLNAGELSFIANGVELSAFSGLSGTVYPFWGSGSGNPGTRSGKLNTGGTAWVYALPSGAGAWG